MSTGRTVSVWREVTTAVDRLITALDRETRSEIAVLATVEAPRYAQYPRVALAQVKAAFPGMPVRTVIATRFHYDHIGGIREFAAEGNLTVITGEPTVSFFEAVLKGPHTIGQDRLEGMPVPARVAPQRGAQRGRLGSQLYDAINELWLDVRTIVGGHSGTDGKTTVFSARIEYLQEAADR
jgi:hypothetical protein